MIIGAGEILALGDSPWTLHNNLNDGISGCSFARQNATVYCLISDQIRIELDSSAASYSKLSQDFFTQKSAWESKGAFHLQELTSQTIPITFNQNYKSSQISQILTSMHEGSGI